MTTIQGLALMAFLAAVIFTSHRTPIKRTVATPGGSTLRSIAREISVDSHRGTATNPQTSAPHKFFSERMVKILSEGLPALWTLGDFITSGELQGKT